MLIEKVFIHFYYKIYFKKFIIIVLLSIFLNNYYHPKISIFIPVYNMQKYISRALLSIQNQTLKDIEVVVVNDCSNDNTLEIIRKFSKNDSRIKLINNRKNRGLLYSRAMGILHSSGEYLMNLDSDDELINQDDLEFLYNKTISSKADIISFDLMNKNPTVKIKNPCIQFDKIIKQPRLFKSIYYKNYVLKDFLITNKLIKKEIFLRAYELFNYYIYINKKWNYHEDNIWSILVNKLSNTKLCVRKKIYKYNYNNKSLINNRYNENELNNIIYRFDMLNKIYNKDINYRYMNLECISISKSIYFNIRFKTFIKSNLELKRLFLSNLKNCLINYKIPKKRKKYLINLMNFIK